jgi:5-methylcytosine-specific restriction enzyme subunit McrC
VRLIELTEVGWPAEFELSSEEGRRLAASGVVTAVPSPFRSGRWLVGSTGKVGAARVGDVEVRIKPKVEIARLFFLLGYSTHGAAWRPETVDVGETPDLVAAVLRGRLLESAQLARQHGLALPLEIRHDEFTTDIPENLRTACERMLLVPRVDFESSRMMRRLLRDFEDVTPLRQGDPIPAWQPSRLNARYQPAMRLAELVLRATSVEHVCGTVAVNGFLLDMPKLFEDFVTVALREAIESAYGGRASPSHGTIST